MRRQLSLPSSTARRGLPRVILAILVVVLAFPSLAVAGENDPDPLGLLIGGGINEDLSLGVDNIAVMICDYPGAPYDLDAATYAAWAVAEVAPFFSLVSGGRYTPVFTAEGTFQASSNDMCLSGGFTAAPPGYTNVMVVANGPLHNGAAGYGGPGTLFVGSNGISAPSLADHVSDSLRGFVIEGRSDDRPLTPMHELGHTLAWPHSGSDGNDYDNLADSMSGAGGSDNSCPGENPGQFFFPCKVVHTVAMNRYASGWIDANQIETVLGGDRSPEIRGPEAGGGKQMALIPSSDPLVFAVVGARPGTGFDVDIGGSGVTIQVLDQTASCFFPVCWGINRRQYSALTGSDSQDYFLDVGESHEIFGVTVTVDAATADGYDVSFTGKPNGCAMGPNPFTDIDLSFAFASIGCIRILGITTGTSATTYAPLDLVTREQMAAFIARLWEALSQECPDGFEPFTDVDEGSYAYSSIICIYELGITTGATETTYGLADTVTREQMAAFLARLWEALGKECPTPDLPFDDMAESFAHSFVACIYGLGITTGTSDTTYGPFDPVTREQMAAFLARLWDAAWA